MIRIEFWNGQLDKKGRLVKTKHNPCLWSNVGVDKNPWRSSYDEALKVLDRWFNKEIDDTELLHHIRFVAYGLGKRDFNDTEVVWWGNMTVNHKPKLVVEDCDKKYTICFDYDKDSDKRWIASIKYDDVEFYWKLE
ncbi:hypothetical protein YASMINEVIRUS_29 [Yasminevirus sp. GU-2018]|uniref:Uncharacterized protein n=1 Tax=Yasminevirus sp. GU-2018 TaxID=2420051 RepID=A0A5K0U768_9VIRU|nr:hypothetical protein YASMINEVIRUS_29 [Yasminevirus sp. GU-2018]